MSGAKGSGGPRENSGGAREGAGRPPKPPSLLTVPAGEDPLAFLLAVMNNAEADGALRVRAAIAAAQYTNTKKHDGGKKDEKAEQAEAAGAGKFAPAAAPKLVVNNS